MKRTVLIVILITIVNTTFGQKWVTETKCFSDTIYIDSLVHYKIGDLQFDTIVVIKAFKCETRSAIGFGFGWGLTRIFYDQQTKDWIGNQGLWNLLNLNFVLNKWNAGVRFKTWTVDPKKELYFDNVLLPTNAKVNPNKIDFYLGYSLDMKKNISFEPYL